MLESMADSVPQCIHRHVTSRKDNYPCQSSHVSEGSLFATVKARLAMCKAVPCSPRQAPSPLPGLLWLATLSYTNNNTCCWLSRCNNSLQLWLCVCDLTTWSVQHELSPSCGKTVVTALGKSKGAWWQCSIRADWQKKLESRS